MGEQLYTPLKNIKFWYVNIKLQFVLISVLKAENQNWTIYQLTKMFLIYFIVHEIIALVYKEIEASTKIPVFT